MISFGLYFAFTIPWGRGRGRVCRVYMGVYGVYMVCIWCVYGVCMVCVWCVYGVCMGVYRVHIGCI